VLASLAIAASAAQWYGVAPDDTIPGLINIFQMTATGTITNSTASVRTADNEYVKSGTFHCSWTNEGDCYFSTGVGAEKVQDAVYAVNRLSGSVSWKHTMPAGIYSDNLVHDYVRGALYYFAFNTDVNPPTAAIVKLDANTGALLYVFDVARDIRGFVWGGDVTMCAQDGHLFVGVDTEGQAAGQFEDYVLEYDITGAQPRLNGGKPLLFPVPSSLHAVCGQSIFGTTIQADAFDREKVLIGDIDFQGREGLFLPVARGELPTFTQRGEIPLFLNNLNADFQGTVLIPLLPFFSRGPGPAPPIDFSLLWTVEPGTRNPGTLSPLRYYLAGAAGVPQL